MRRLAAALLVAGALACGCTQGFMLDDGERPAAELTDAKFVFAEGQTEIELRPAPTSLKPTPHTYAYAGADSNARASAHSDGLAGIHVRRPRAIAGRTHRGAGNRDANPNGELYNWRGVRGNAAHDGNRRGGAAGRPSHCRQSAGDLDPHTQPRRGPRAGDGPGIVRLRRVLPARNGRRNRTGKLRLPGQQSPAGIKTR